MIQCCALIGYRPKGRIPLLTVSGGMGGAATGRDSVYFSGGMGQNLFHLGAGTMGGVDTGRSGNIRGPVLGIGNNDDDDDSFNLDMDGDDIVTGRDNPTVSGGMGGGATNLSLGRDDTLVSGGMGMDPVNLSLGPGRDDPTVSGYGGMGVAPLNLSMGRDDGTVSGGMGVAPINLSMGRDGATVSGGMRVAPLNLSLGRENENVSGGMGVAPFDLSLGGDTTVSGGIGAGEEMGEQGRRVANVSWEGQGEDRMRALSIDKLHAIAKSEQNFAVLLVRKFFSKEQLNGHSVFGGRKGKMALDKELLERVKGIYFSFYPTDNKQDTWKRCVTAHNTFLRGQEHKNKS